MRGHAAFPNMKKWKTTHEGIGAGTSSGMTPAPHGNGAKPQADEITMQDIYDRHLR